MDLNDKNKRIKELESLIKEKKHQLIDIKKMSDRYNSLQLALKIVLNSSYGALAQKHFVCFCNAVASTITAHGRDLIQYMEQNNENYWYEEFHKDIELHKEVMIFKKVIEFIEFSGLNKEKILNDPIKYEEIKSQIDLTNIKIPEITPIDSTFINVDTKETIDVPKKSDVYVEGTVRRKIPVSNYCDTDSVDGESILRTEIGEIKIKDYYDYCYNKKIDFIKDDKGHEIVLCNNENKVLNYTDENKLYMANVKKIVKHKVKKEKWLLRTKSGKEIYITNDHSMVVIRNNIQIFIKPFEILKTDKVITSENINYKIEEIDICECVGFFENEYVYDVEMEDESHTFIANDILVHNSLFVSFKPALQKLGIKSNHVDYILFICKFRLQGFFKNKLDEYADKYKVKNIQDFEMEQISKGIIYLKKKMYIKNVVYDEGIYYEPETNLQAKGVDLVRSSTPAFTREKVYDILKYFFQNTETYNDRSLVKYVRELKELFKLAPIEYISNSSSCSKYNEKIIDDQDSLKYVKGTHHCVKSSALHNYLLNNNSEWKQKYNLIKSGQKVKYYYTTNSLNSEFAYIAGQYPKELAEKYAPIDYDTQFEKCVLKLVNRFAKALGLSELTPKLTFTMSLF